MKLQLTVMQKTCMQPTGLTGLIPVIVHTLVIVLITHLVLVVTSLLVIQNQFIAHLQHHQ
ncbi:hypothetical protein IFVP69_C2160104 [Vibrio parahaemolyticus]